MSDLNAFCCTGRLTRDPEVRFLAGDKSVASISLAVSRRFTSGGEAKEETLFLDCDAWGKLADIIGKHLTKGRQVAVSGRLRMDSWDDKATGAKRSKIKCTLESVSFIGKGPEHDAPPSTAPAAAARPSRAAREAEADVGRFADTDDPPF